MSQLKTGLIFSIFCAMLQGCYMDNAEDLYGVDCGVANTPAESISFENDILPILETNCAISGCHAAGNGGGRIELISQQKVTSAIVNNDLKKRVVEGSMPPGGVLSTCDKESLILWIDHNFPTI